MRYAQIAQFGVLTVLFGGIIVWLIKSKIPPVFLKPDVWQDLELIDKKVRAMQCCCHVFENC